MLNALSGVATERTASTVTADEESNTLVTGTVVVDDEIPIHIWECCCIKLDRDCVVYMLQTVIGCALIAFSCIQLATEDNADKTAPYWGLVGSMCGFIFIKAKAEHKRRSLRTNK